MSAFPLGGLERGCCPSGEAGCRGGGTARAPRSALHTVPPAGPAAGAITLRDSLQRVRGRASCYENAGPLARCAGRSCCLSRREARRIWERKLGAASAALGGEDRGFLQLWQPAPRAGWGSPRLAHLDTGRRDAASAPHSAREAHRAEDIPLQPGLAEVWGSPAGVSSELCLCSPCGYLGAGRGGGGGLGGAQMEAALTRLLGRHVPSFLPLLPSAPRAPGPAH